MYYLHKIYYQLIDTKTVNLYRLILLIEEYTNLYRQRVMHNRGEFTILDKINTLFYLQDSSVRYHNFMKIDQLQTKIEETYHEICQRPESKEYKINTDKFKEFYIDQFYHIQQEPDTAIKWIKNDIQLMNDTQTTSLIF